MLELSKRMQMNAALVPNQCSLADIGCDHAYVSITLAKENRCKKIIALDINRGPLAIAERNICRFQVENVVSCRLSNGMEKLVPGEVDTVLIAGMGGMLICRILRDKPDVLAQVHTLILQPQSDWEEVRKTLWQLGFCIEEECFCFDAGKYYLSIRAVRGEEESVYSEEECTYGRILPKKKDERYFEWLLHEKEKAQTILYKLDGHDSDSAHQQKCHMTKKINQIQTLIAKYYGG